jgi:hypothetical protein
MGGRVPGGALVKLVATMAVRNEGHVLGLTARAALLWCDAMVIYLHACTDESGRIAAEIASEHEGRVAVLHQVLPAWDEMSHRQSMLNAARGIGATHIAIVDADEILTGNLLNYRSSDDPGAPLGRSWCSEVVHGLPNGHILQLPLYNLRGSLTRYHSNGIWGNRWLSVAFADDPRLKWEGDKFHHREPTATGYALRDYKPISQGQGGVMHLWGVDEARLIARHRLYKVTERIRWPHKPVHEIEMMYNWATKGATVPQHMISFGTPDTWTYAETPAEWWAPYAELLAKYYHPEVEPWQTAECDRLIAEHGRAYFKGLTV